jgi:hypothetical protein
MVRLAKVIKETTNRGAMRDKKINTIDAADEKGQWKTSAELEI